MRRTRALLWLPILMLVPPGGAHAASPVPAIECAAPPAPDQPFDIAKAGGTPGPSVLATPELGSQTIDIGISLASISAGSSLDERTRVEIERRLRLLTACFNTGDPERVNPFFSDDW